MDKKEITEGNLLIAEYCGWVVIDGEFNHLETLMKDVFLHSELIMYMDQDSELRFNSSWDWLMPVVEKIAEDFDVLLSSVGTWACYISRKDVNERSSVADIAGHSTPIDNAFLTVVDFIKWYNKQPKYKK